MVILDSAEIRLLEVCVQLYMNRPGLINVLKVMELLVCPLAKVSMVLAWCYNILISSLCRSLEIFGRFRCTEVKVLL